MEISRKLSRLLSEKKQQSKSLDRKLATSCQQFFTQSIEFRPASGPDSHLENLKSLYRPLNKVIPEPARARVNMDPEQNTNTDSNKNIADSKSSEIIPRKVLYDSEHLEMDWKRVRSIGAGLSNMGNTCFLNSVLQCLSYTPPLVNYLLSGEHKQSCCVSGFCAMCEFQRHCSQVHTASHGCVKPVTIVHNLRAIAKHFRLGRQEDAHEFLRYFIDGMQKSCLHGYPAKLDPHSKATTVVHQIFGGYHRSQVKCLECMKTSDTFDPLLDVSLDIKSCNSLTKALHKSIKPDLLEGDNSYACPYCKKMTKAQKRFTIQRLPRVLTLQLKRFDFNSMFGGKVNKEVNYPEHIDMRPFMSDPHGSSQWYRLYAVLVHLGFSCHSGHYYCYVRSSNGCWFCMNDSQVSQASQSTVLQQEAYLLFYIRDENYISKTQGVRSDPNFLSSPKKPLSLDKTGTPFVQKKPTGVVPPSPKIIPLGKDKTPLVNGKRTQEFSIPLRKTPVPMTNKATPTVATPTNVSSTSEAEQKKPVFIPRQIKTVGKIKKSSLEKEKLVAPPTLSPLIEMNEDSKEGVEDSLAEQAIPLAGSIQTPTTPTRNTAEPAKNILDYTNSPLDQPTRLIGPMLPPTHAQKSEDDSTASPRVALVSPQRHSSTMLGSGSKPVALVRPSPHLTPDNVKQESVIAKAEETPAKDKEPIKATPTSSPHPSPKHVITPSHKHTSPPPQSSPQVDSTTSGDVTASPEAAPYGPDLSSDHVTSTLEQATPSPKPAIKFSPQKHHKKHKKKIYRKHSQSELDDEGQKSNDDEEPSTKPHPSKKADSKESGHKKSSHDKERARSRSRDRDHKSHHHRHSISSPSSGRSREGHHEGAWRRHEKHRDSQSKSPRPHSRRSHSRSPQGHRHSHGQGSEHAHRHRHHSHRSHSSERVKRHSRSHSPHHHRKRLHSHESGGERVKENLVRHERVKESPVRHERVKESPLKHDRVKESAVKHERVKESPEKHERAKESPEKQERVKESPVKHEDKVYRIKLKRKHHHSTSSLSPEGKRHKSDSSVETPKSSKHITAIVWDGPKKSSSKWDGSKSSDVLQQLTSQDRGVRSWEGGESVLECGPSREDRRRRDSWDEELDRGKVKKVKKPRSDGFHSSNRFQEFHDRRSSGSHYHKGHRHHKPHYHHKARKWHH